MKQRIFILTLVLKTPRGCGYSYGGYFFNNNHNERLRFKPKMV
jgi:hypothetical protein